MSILDELYNNSLVNDNKSESSVETIVGFYPGEEELRQQNELQKNLMECNDNLNNNENHSDEKDDYDTKVNETNTQYDINENMKKNENINKKGKKKRKNKKKKNNKIMLIAKDKTKEEKEKLSSLQLGRQFSQKINHNFKKSSNSLIKENNKDLEDIIDNNKSLIRSTSSQILNKKILEESSDSEEENKRKKKKKIKKKNLKPVVTNFIQKLKEKETLIDHLQKVRKMFSEKKFVPEKYFTYVINPGNASYLIKKAMAHRINWRESSMSVTSLFNFKWQQNTKFIDYDHLSQIESLPQVVNHFEFCKTIANKSNLFSNLFDYCEKNDINVFKYIPFTIIISQGNDNEKNFNHIFQNIENYIVDNDKIEMKKKKNLNREKLYSNYFLLEDKNIVGQKTEITIPSTHYNKKNLWVIKAVNLNRGQCIRIADSVDKIHDIIKTLNTGIKLTNITKENNENNIQFKYDDKREIPLSDTYKSDKIIIQKYIEKPLLYYGRKCDMRIWVLLSHQMKVFVFKEGHLKTCSAKFDINNNKDAFVHITNYSFQKHCDNFQKFELGNEVPFYDFQKFLDKFCPENKKISVEKDIMSKIKEIVMLSLNSVKEKINQNNRNFCFEIFGYDFMLDSQFNVYLIEINMNPGIEISSPWINVIIPRMIDDALRLTIDSIFPTKFHFEKTQDINLEDCKNDLGMLDRFIVKKKQNLVDKGAGTTDKNDVNNDNNDKNNHEKNTNMNENINDNNNNEIKETINNKNINNEGINDKNNGNNNSNNDNNKISSVQRNKEENEKNADNSKNVYKEKINDIILDENDVKNMNEKENEKNKDENKEKENSEYISPYPVPGYSNNENLWEEIGDISIKKKSYTGLRYILSKRESKSTS